MIQEWVDAAVQNALRPIFDLFARMHDAVTSWLSLDWVPELFFWYWYLFLLFMLISVVIYLFGWSKIVRIVSSVIFAAAAIFVAGGHVMSRRLKKREQRSRDRR